MCHVIELAEAFEVMLGEEWLSVFRYFVLGTPSFCQLSSAQVVSADMPAVINGNPLPYLQTQTVLSRWQTRWSEYVQMFTFKRLSMPSNSNVAAQRIIVLLQLCCLLLVQRQCSCAGVPWHNCKCSNQQLIVKWKQSNGDCKLDDPSLVVMATVAASRVRSRCH